MCGIVAIYARGADAQPVDRGELVRIRDRMAARGPDGIGEWLSPDARVGMGQRRLAIIDLRPIADQPMAHAGGRLQIVFNGEIYNYRALRAELEAAGHVFVTESDTEVVLQLYERHGAALTEKLRGMYAFALWDENKRGMLLARDPLGIKPLYYADDGKTLRVASQVKALLEAPVDTRAEPAGHVGFFLWGWVPEPWTLHRGIRALPAGTTLWVDAAGLHGPAPFFHLNQVLAAAPSTATPQERWEGLRAALCDSIAHHQVADVPVGVFLSAGLDSSTIVALATEEGSTNLETVTLGFREFAGTENDETVLAEAVARQRKTQHKTHWVTASAFAAGRDALMTAMDQPSIDGVNTYFVAQAARAAGLKVALSGLGGDEIFGGYPSFRQVPRMAATLAPFAAIPALGKAFRAVSTDLLKRFTSPKYAGLLEYGGTAAGAYLLRRSLFMPWELPDLLPGEIVREGWAELATLARLEASIAGLRGGRPTVSALEMSWYMRNQLLRDADWAGMAHALEIRVPFVDPVLLRTLAPHLASRTPPDKKEMANTAAMPLPEAVLARRKTGFVVPVRQWLMGEGGTQERGLRGWAREVWRAQGGLGAAA